ncbi:MAG: hypothetical protein SO373_01035 [Candidatus Borkfalkiaceae bacterium]|nr:hypothetical protein [Christensenellaceae bacterium]
MGGYGEQIAGLRRKTITVGVPTVVFSLVSLFSNQSLKDLI